MSSFNRLTSTRDRPKRSREQAIKQIVISTGASRKSRVLYIVLNRKIMEEIAELAEREWYQGGALPRHGMEAATRNQVQTSS